MQNLGNLKKEDLVDIFNLDLSKNTKKDVLLKESRKRLKDNEILYEKLYTKYRDNFSLCTQEVEEILECSKTERQRWTKDGKLTVCYTEPFTKYGKDLSVPHYDFISIYEAKKHIKKWRKEYEEEKKQNIKQGIENAKETKEKNNQKRQEFKKEFKSTLVSWYKNDYLLGSTYELAYWTVWISRWAKENHLKAINAKKACTQENYLKNEKELYDLKSKAFNILVKTPFAKLSFYQPDCPDKVSNIHLCDYHYNDWCFQRGYDYMSIHEYFAYNSEEVLKCNNCSVTIEENYYSLYYLEIADDRVPDYKFSFHLPYPIGEKTYPNIDKLPQVEHNEQDGIFRFGRALFDDEKIIYREKNVIDNFNAAFKKLSLFYKKEE